MTAINANESSNPAWQWVLKFTLLSAGFYFILTSNAFHQSIETRFIALMMQVSSLLLDLLGLSHEIHGNVVQISNGQFSVGGSCTGLLVFGLFSAAVLSFPASIKEKLEGLTMGFVVLFFLNTLRILGIIVIGSRFPKTFWSLHIIAGQILIIAGVSGIFLFWLTLIKSDHRFYNLLFQHNLVKISVLFIVGYAMGYALYYFFLNSSPGIYIAGMIEHHTHWILNLISQGTTILAPGQSVAKIRFNPGCLSSPVFVIFLALLTAWPCSLKNKIVLALICFIPVFYGYHLLRALLTAISLTAGATKTDSLIYNCYGQFILSAAGIIIFWYRSLFSNPQVPFKAWVQRCGLGILAGSAAVMILGKPVDSFLLPAVARWIHPEYSTFYDPQMTLSTISYFQYFCFYCLVVSIHGVSRQILKGAAAGTAILLGSLFAFISIVELLQLQPHVGIIKFSGTAMPFLLYYLIFFRNTSGQAIQKSTGKPQASELGKS